MKGYPKWFSAAFISSIFAVLFASGLLLAPTTLEIKLDWDIPWRLSPDSKIMIAALHTFFSFVSLVVIGALSSIHMRQEWKLGKNRISGATLIATLIFLSFSGLGIFYFGSEKLSAAASLSHLGVGVAFLGIYAWHIFWFKNKSVRTTKKPHRRKSP